MDNDNLLIRDQTENHKAYASTAGKRAINEMSVRTTHDVCTARETPTHGTTSQVPGLARHFGKH